MVLRWRVRLGVGLVGGVIWASPAIAQVIPDSTLGAESSVVAPNTIVRGAPAELIQGGAIRGANLFHSFLEFGVADGQRVYFANPTGVQSILSRVTGTAASSILGTLGVDGGASLFLLNPNGLLFGPNARLDIAGSFLATTADSFVFDNGLPFSAANPEAAPLLTVNLRPGLQYGPTRGQIETAANLSVGQQLTLAATALDLQGQLRAGGDLTLYGRDTVRVRDGVTTPFVARAGGELRVQGDRTVDIFTLNHPSSGFFAGRDLVLRSANTVSGDAHFWSGGNFRIEQLNGQVGNLNSPNDPIIRSIGDVILGGYTGGSLHILAGGSVAILGDVTITGADATALVGAVPLSDGTVQSIDGRQFSTLDIRAGLSPAVVGFPAIEGDGVVVPPLLTLPIATGSDILIQGTVANSFDSSLVFLSNFNKNPALPDGSIVTGQINAFGGSVVIDARNAIVNPVGIDASISAGTGGSIKLLAGLGGIDTRGGTLTAGSGSGNGGDITLLASGNVRTGTIRSFVSPDGNGNGGNLRLASQFGGIEVIGFLESSSGERGQGNGGDVTLTALGDISVVSTAGFAIGSFSGNNGQGNGGAITLTSGLGAINTTSGLVVSSTSDGNGGPVTMQALGDIRTAGIESFVGGGGIGFAGDITLTSRAGVINTTAGILKSLVGEEAVGFGGTVTLTAFGNITTGSIESRVLDRGQGRAGDIILFSQSGAINTTGGTLSSSTPSGFSGAIRLTAFGDIGTANVEAFSTGEQAGDITITSTNGIFFLSGSQVSSQAANSAQGGSISVRARSVFLTNQAEIAASTFGQGDAGDLIFVQADEIVALTKGSQIRGTVEAGGNGKASDIEIRARSLSVLEGSQIQSVLFRSQSDSTGRLIQGGQGQGGEVRVFASDLVLLSGTGPDGFSSGLLTLTERGAGGPAGNITVDVSTGTFRVESGAVVAAGTRNRGNAGDITIAARRFEALSGGRILGISGSTADQTGTTTGAAGTITIAASDSILISGTDPNFQNRLEHIDDYLRREGQQRGETRLDVLLRQNSASGLFTDTQDTGRGGNILARTTGSFELTDHAQINSSTFGRGGFANAGTVAVQATGTVLLDQSTIFSSVEAGAEGTAGGILIEASSITLQNDTELQAQTAGIGNAGLVSLSATTGNITFDNSRVFSTVERGGQGSAGGIIATANSGSITLSNGAELQTLIREGGRGQAGSILLLAPTSTIAISDSSIVSSIEPGAIGDVSAPAEANFFGVNRGVVGIAANNIVLSNQATIDVATKGRGDAGLAFLVANDTVSLDNSQVSSTVELVQDANNFVIGRAFGDAGGIGIQARSVSLSNGAGLQALTRADGRAGAIIINASDSVTIAGVAPDGTYSTGAFTSTEDTAGIGNSLPEGGSIQITTGRLRIADGAVLSARTRNPFRGGNILLDAAVLEVTGGGQVLTTAFQSGQAGDIFVGRNLTVDAADNRVVTINGASDRVTLAGRDSSYFVRQQAAARAEQRARLSRGTIFDNIADGASGLFSNTELNSTARGGSVQVATGRLLIRDGAEISVETQGTGVAGNIELQAATIRLQNQGELKAFTRSGSGGNITFTASDSLLMIRNSQISTDAGREFGGGDGGNIRITTPFIIATPTRDSNIRADAYRGNGGSIRIFTQQLFSIDRRPLSPRTNDINASSTLGVNGEIQIDASKIDPSRGLVALPLGLVDPSDRIDQSCAPRNEQIASSFVVTGRGGLPETPESPRSGGSSTNWTMISEGEGNSVGGTMPQAPAETTIVEAQGWAKDADGNLLLVAQSAPIDAQVPVLRSLCP